MSRRKITIAIAGAGNRGSRYAKYALAHPDEVQVVAVAEPRDAYRARLAEEHRIPEKNVFKDWRELAAGGKIADAVIIAVQDQFHREPAIKFAESGYDILLEKPMAVNEQDCRDIVKVSQQHDVLLCVCHVMRYTQYTRRLKEIIDSGVIGGIININHIEPVGYWHFAHSYVRGNWRNSGQSSFMLLAKCCHDVDWLGYVAGTEIKSVSSFGNLKFFQRSNAPEGAAKYCVDCPLKDDKCPYSATKIYLEKARQGCFEWPNNVITSELTEEGVYKAIQKGPYGRCVFDCDNDVVDHQVVTILFENGSTATLTVTAFTELSDRKTHIFGTKGQLYGDGNEIVHYDFQSDKRVVHSISKSDGSILTGHGGGDYEIMKSFIRAVSCRDRTQILSGPAESLQSHLAVFAAEQARLTSSVVTIGANLSWGGQQ